MIEQIVENVCDNVEEKEIVRFGLERLKVAVVAMVLIIVTGYYCMRHGEVSCWLSVSCHYDRMQVDITCEAVEHVLFSHMWCCCF